ncbi:MAG TPA: hypothetical protein VMU28_15390 [Terriglobales bacterium]|nr:hypothetical protein [Terriglobales bacterium]
MSFFDRILDRTQQMPKFVDPATHSVLDYLTISYFFVVAGLFWGKHNRAAATALINGGMVLGLSMLTDYPGGLKKIPFRDHGKGDMMQALTAAGLPAVLGFGNEGAALPFRLQALNEAMVIAITDFDSEKAHQQALEAEREAAA